GISWSEAIAMATQVPARITGMDLRKGRIAPGADADLIALDSRGCVRRTWVRGLLAYQGEPVGTGESVLS
ncbi:MAG TPA: amidohydrolase family protein, partial [Ktedonobacteraceae bacterium]|nr:amidohydrolase family protein [Ktedonobacteraceae bacterium]